MCVSYNLTLTFNNVSILSCTNNHVIRCVAQVQSAKQDDDNGKVVPSSGTPYVTSGDLFGATVQDDGGHADGGCDVAMTAETSGEVTSVDGGDSSPGPSLSKQTEPEPVPVPVPSIPVESTDLSLYEKASPKGRRSTSPRSLGPKKNLLEVLIKSL